MTRKQRRALTLLQILHTSAQPILAAALACAVAFICWYWLDGFIFLALFLGAVFGAWCGQLFKDWLEVRFDRIWKRLSKARYREIAGPAWIISKRLDWLRNLSDDESLRYTTEFKILVERCDLTDDEAARLAAATIQRERSDGS